MIFFLLFHFLFSTVLAFLLANLYGHLTPTIAIVSLIFGTLLARRYTRPFKARFRDFRVKSFLRHQAGLIESVIFVYVLYAAWRHFTWLLYPNAHGLFTLSAFNFGDLPLHIQFIRSFANQIHFPPVNPIFSSELLRYPYGVDLYNALWECLGVRLQAHLFAVGLLSTLTTLVLLRVFAGWWGMGALFLSGGAAAWMTNALQAQSILEWKNLFLSVFITQRGILFAIPMGLFLLIAIRRHANREVTLTKKQMTALGIMWGFLPLFHLHAFLVVSLMLAALVFEQGGVRGLFGFMKSRIALFAYLPAIALIWHSTQGFHAASIAHLSPGWTMKGQTLLPFLWLNFGAWLFVPPLILFGLLIPGAPFSKNEKKALAFEWFTYAVLFGVFYNVMLAPWEWDNIKLLIWPYLGFARLASIVIEARLQPLPTFSVEGERRFTVFASVLRPLMAYALLYTGFAATMGTLQNGTSGATQIYRTEDLANTEGVLKNVNPNSAIAASTTHTHALTYWGRIRALGYEGHLWSHGLNAKPRLAILDQMMRQTDDTAEFIKEAKELGVQYVFWGVDEIKEYGSRDRKWQHELKKIASNDGATLYSLDVVDPADLLKKPQEKTEN